MGKSLFVIDENSLRAEQEHLVAHGYDTADRDLERLGMTISRLPSEAGVIWRLTLPRGEQFEAWEPGTAGLAPPDEILQLISGIVGEKALVPSAPVSNDAGVARLREMLEEQRRALLTSDPGARLGTHAENLHRHRVAARRSRAFLHAVGGHVDPDWRRSLARSLRGLGEATGPVRDLDVLLEHLLPQLRELSDSDQRGAATLAASLAQARTVARARLLEALDEERYHSLLVRLQQPPRLHTGVDAIPLDRIARREFRRLAKAVKRLGKHPSESGVHGLRIALKRARYAAELSAPAGKARRAFLEAAGTLQLLLGEHHDAVVAESLLRSSTVVDDSTAAAFVAGRIAERQIARRAQITEQLPAAWRRLRKRGSRL
jgi:CHAD domain-containing protein